LKTLFVSITDAPSIGPRSIPGALRIYLKERISGGWLDLSAGTGWGAPTWGDDAGTEDRTAGTGVEDGRADDDTERGGGIDDRSGQDDGGGAGAEGTDACGSLSSAVRIGRHPPGTPKASRHPICRSLFLLGVRYSMVMSLPE
jgi:hypothetical protein